jgi:predicted deacetylase
MIIKILLFEILSIIALLLIAGTADGTVYVVFRYDDFAGNKPYVREAEPAMMKIWEAEKAIDDLFNKYGVPYVVSVIPATNSRYSENGANLKTTFLEEDQEKVKFIKHAVQAGRVEVAQHGFSHTNHAGSNHKRGEFRERDYESQFQDITRGREILLRALDLTDLSTFVPPYNGWDRNTAKAIKAAGFRILSADFYYYYDSVEGLVLIPFTSQLWELESMLNQGHLQNDSVIVVIYHPAQIVKFQGSEGRFFGIERFEKLLQKLMALPNTKVVTFQQLSQECSSLTTMRYHTVNVLWRLRSFWGELLPQHLWPGESNHALYLPIEAYATQLMFWKTLTIALIAGLLFAGLMARYLVRLVLPAKWCFRVDVIASLLFFLSLLKEIQIIHKGYHLTGISMIPAIFTASFLIALVMRIARKPVSIYD